MKGLVPSIEMTIASMRCINDHCPPCLAFRLSHLILGLHTSAKPVFHSSFFPFFRTAYSSI